MPKGREALRHAASQSSVTCGTALSIAHKHIRENGQYDDHSDDDPLNPNLRSHHIESVFQSLPESGSREGSKKKSRSPKRRDSSDDSRRDAVHLVHVSGLHIAHSGLCAEDIAHDYRTECADQIGLNRSRHDIHSREPCGVRIGADRIDMSSDPGFPQKKIEDEEKEERDPEGIIDSERFSIVEKSLKAVPLPLSENGRDIIRIAVSVDQIADPARNEHGAERGDKRRQLELPHQNAVQKSDQKPEAEGQKKRRNQWDSPRHKCRAHHRAHPHHRSDGEVDISRDHDDTLSQSDQKVFRHGAEQIQDILKGQNLRIDQAKHDIYDDEARKCRQSPPHSPDLQKPFERVLLLFHILSPFPPLIFSSQRPSQASKSRSDSPPPR